MRQSVGRKGMGYLFVSAKHKDKRKLMSNQNIFRLLRIHWIVHLVKLWTMTSPVLFLFLFFSIQANCFGFRTIRNHAFTGLISQKIYDVDWLGCLEACSRSKKCVSYNYKWCLDVQDEVNVCELIDDHGECDTSSLVYMTGCTFHQIRENSKVKIECEVRIINIQLHKGKSHWQYIGVIN